jgi:hypothetical protein
MSERRSQKAADSSPDFFLGGTIAVHRRVLSGARLVGLAARRRHRHHCYYLNPLLQEAKVVGGALC